MGKFTGMFRTRTGCQARRTTCIVRAVAMLLALVVPTCGFAQQVRIDAQGIAGVDPARGDAPVHVDRLAAGALLGRYAQLLDEAPGRPLTLEQARTELATGAFRRSRQVAPNLGNNAPPLWLHLNIDDQQASPHDYRIYVAQNWADKVDAWLLGPDGHVRHWEFGVDRAPGRYLRPGPGYGIDAQLQPGHSELFVRTDSADSVALALRIVPMAATGQLEGAARGWLDLVHGFLLALVVTFGLLWLSLRETSLLRYVLYVGAYLYMHFAYSGVAALVVWPDSPHVARYAILIGMVLFASAGIWFAREFLGLAQWHARVDRALAWLVRGVLLAMTICVAADLHVVAIKLAFSYILLFTLLMVGLGALAVRARREQSRIFLGASLASMVGAFITTLTVMGHLPFSPLSFHAVEVGVMLEASVWALALGLRLRRVREDRVRALQLAERDSLTGLYNRRGFAERAAPTLADAGDGEPGTALAMLDIDLFKAINDQHGHNVGDLTLVAVADRLRALTRRTDSIARWGGEEFLVLMPQTSLEEARVIAERIRAALAATSIAIDNGERIRFTASIGIANKLGAVDVPELVHQADIALYQAKQAGRNRVASHVEGAGSAACAPTAQAMPRSTDASG